MNTQQRKLCKLLTIYVIYVIIKQLRKQKDKKYIVKNKEYIDNKDVALN